MTLRVLSISAVGVLVVAGFILGSQVYQSYQRDVRVAEARIDNLGSQVVNTACGPVEYVVRGEGYPVLVVHGIVGGFDAGIASIGDMLGDGYRLIIPSRFGYLRTPLPENATPATQADAHACLLDSLGVKRAAVVAFSAGATSAMQLALRHPESVSALVLIVPNAPDVPGTTVASPPPRPVANVLYRSNFIFWLATTRFRPALQGVMGVPKGFELTPAHEREIDVIMRTVFPVKPRAEGVLFDSFVSNPAVNSGYRFGDISAPTLVVSARDDAMAGYANARALAARIPGARLLTVDSGGHLLLGQSEPISEGVQVFLREHGAVEP